MSIIGAGLTFFLPETCDQILPNTIEDANCFGEDQGYFDCILCIFSGLAAGKDARLLAPKIKLQKSENGRGMRR